jgi:hypothetical protein
MKKQYYLVPSAALLGTLAVFQWSKHQTAATDRTSAASPRQTSSQLTNLDRLVEQSLAAKGQLWETMESNGRERMSKTMPVDPQCFAAASTSEIGTTLSVALSKQMPALQATVSARKTETDGTVITHLYIAGAPEGQLTIQENVAMDFFVAQLYYQNHPVAYEFKKADDAMIATRHELSEMICSLIDHQSASVTQMGLPPVDKARGKKADEADQSAIEKAKKLVQEAKPGTGGGGSGTGPSLSIADVNITEGNSGSKSLTFTVRLSKADRNRVISVNYSTADGSALGGSDYTPVSGTVSIAAGRTTNTLTVPIIGDTMVETDETFAVNLSTPVNATIADAQAIGTIVNDDSPPSSVPVFNSLPGAVAVAYLDMDGQVVSGTQWAGGGTINARGIVGTLTNTQLLEICRRTAEDYSPFQINVTTEESVYLAAPSNRRIRCIITPDNEWYGSAGGVAYLNSFTWTGDTPCWVFSDMLSNSARYIAEATSHEIGHTLSLYHDGRTSPSEAYYQGHGTGEVGWAPIMGVGYYKLLVQWSRGEYLSANNTENDLNKITTLNGFGYRADAVPNTTAGAVALTGTTGARSASGILETTGDQDVFSFSTAGGACAFSAVGDALSQNVDVLLELLDGSGAVIASANPDTLTDASVSATVASGTYYLRVSGVGRGDVLADGYSNYASIGQYTISGNAP